LDIFKGYLPMRGKRAMEAYKDRTSFYTIGAVSEFDGYGGILNDAYIQIDLDISDEAQILLKIVEGHKINCRVLKTSRGMHFYFRNTGQNRNRVGAKLAIGLSADIGVKNRLVPLKIDGIVREWIFQPDEIDPLPQWLNPVDKVPDFHAMDEGDGRNQTLFNYILALQAAGFSKQDARFTLQIVNQYVLKKPLPKRELETIFRDEAFAKPAFFNGSSFQHDIFAEYLCRELNVVVAGGRVHFYNGQAYITDKEEIEKQMVNVLSSLTVAKRKEVLSHLKLIAPRKPFANSKYIAVKNGILDFETLTLMPFTPELVIPNQIPHDWNPDVQAPVVDTVLDKISCGDEGIRLLLEEAPGYALLRRSSYGATFFLTGFGKNGKSTYLDMVKGLLGKSNYSAVALKSLDERFKTAELFGKLANIGDDIGKTFIEDNSIFKNIATGNTINVERKGEDPFDFDPYAKLFFSANEMPRIKDTTNGLMRRLWQIPFNARFSKNKPDFDPLILDKLRSDEAMQRFLVLAVHALRRIVENKGLSEPKAILDEKRLYELKNNPVLQFMEDRNIIGSSTKEVYLLYGIWCRENGHQPLSSIELGKELSRHFGVISKPTKIDGKLFRTYVQSQNGAEVTDGYS